MKKQLLRGLTLVSGALVLAACSSEYDFDSKHGTKSEREETFNEIFVDQFGEPDAYHTWGFDKPEGVDTRANNPGETYPETSTGINANANEWADPDKYYGGWVVPDPLTEAQKALVAKYFQSVPNLRYTDPQWRNFFVQQVYKGGNETVNGTTEGIIGANGSAYTSDNMNLLTVGYNDQHINNFNGGTASYVNVLDNGQHVDGTSHSDQIMLMVNIDDTECMGYHCSATGESGEMISQRNDKAALVSWETIRQWARDNNCYTEDILNDGWDRSFVGFDLALKSFENSCQKDENGDKIYAKLSDLPYSADIAYVWDGEKTIPIKSSSDEASNPDLTSKLGSANLWGGTMTEEGGVYTYSKSSDWGGFDFAINNENWTGYTKLVIEFAEPTPAEMNINIKCNGDQRLADVAWDAATTKVEIDLTGNNYDNVTQFFIQTNAGTFKFSKIYLEGKATKGDTYDNEYIVVDGEKIPLLITEKNQFAGESITVEQNELKITKDGKSCLNLEKIKELVKEGYYPTEHTLTEWSKWEDGDGYYSDWIVTLNKAQRITDTTTVVVKKDYSRRVIAEDLGTAENTDFDYNDVVFDVVPNDAGTETTITLQAAGGTLPLYIVVFKEGTVTANGYTFDPNDSNIEWKKEVHEWFGVDTKVMVNTNAGTTVAAKSDVIKRGIYAKDVRIFVNKSGWYEINAYVGQPAQKLAVGLDFVWPDERVSITTKSYYSNFLEYVHKQDVFGDDSYKLWYTENPYALNDEYDKEHQGTIGVK